jgi:hypothetical protein
MEGKTPCEDREKESEARISINSNFLRQSVLINIWHRTYQQLANELLVHGHRRCASYSHIVNVDEARKSTEAAMKLLAFTTTSRG